MIEIREHSLFHKWQPVIIYLKVKCFLIAGSGGVNAILGAYCDNTQ